MRFRKPAIVVLVALSALGSWSFAQSDDSCSPAMVWGQHKWGASSWGVETACDIRSNIINLIILLKEREKAAATSSEGGN